MYNFFFYTELFASVYCTRKLKLNEINIMKALTFSFLLALFLMPGLAEAQSEPPNGMNELEAYSVFTDAVKNNDYQMAINFGGWMMEATPRELEGHPGFDLERQFDRMVDVYDGAAENEQDPAIKSDYLNKAADVFNKFGDTFSAEEIDVYSWELKEGRFYHEHRSNMEKTMDDAIQHYMNAYEVDPERFTKEADGYYAEVVLRDLSNSGNRDRAFQVMDTMMAYASESLESAINETRESLFESPEERIEFYESQLAEAEGSDREEILVNLRDFYKETENIQKSEETALELYELNPNLENTRSVAEIYLSDGDFSQAIDYLLEAEELAESDDVRHELMLEIAEAYQQMEEYEHAREYARSAINLDENSGDAYLRMASIYANTIRSCVDGSKLEREDRAVYWLVLDYLEQAENMDPSVASTAQSQADSYTEAMPSDEHKFFNEWTAGNDFEIDGTLKSCYGWINETTTVR